MSLYDYKVDGVTYTQVDNPSGGCKGCIAFSNNELCKKLSHDCALKLWVLREEDNLQDYTQNNTEKYSGEVQKKSNNIRVGNKVQWCGESGTVIEVTDDRFIVEWRDGCSTESIKYHEDYGVTLLPDEQDNLVKEYIQKIQDKYPEEEERNAINPKHYDLFPEHGIQVRELMQVLCDKLDRQGFSGFLCSDYVQAMQYFLRWFEKNGVEDIEKGIFYMNKIIKQVQEMEKL